MDESRGEAIENFTTTDLVRIRALVKRIGLEAGLSAARTDDLVLAVNEIAVNAIVHAGGGSVIVEVVPTSVVVVVLDHGPGLPPNLGTDLPSPTVLGGRGLWLVRQLCPQVTFSNGVRGHAVRLLMPRSAM